MRTKRLIGLTVVVAMLLTASLAFAAWKGYRGSGGWGMGSQYQRMYDPKTVETITGTVEAVDQVTPMKGMSYGVHLQLKTEKETISVHLGPGWYIERLDTKIEKGDKVQIKGSRVTMMGQPAIVAAEVKKAIRSLSLETMKAYLHGLDGKGKIQDTENRSQKTDNKNSPALSRGRTDYKIGGQ